MHELPVVEEMITALDEESRAKNISKIKEVHLVIGELSSYVDECIQMYFDMLSPGHSCEGARLYFNYTKASFRCEKCGKIFEHENSFDCPACGGRGIIVKGTGKEFLIKKVVV